MGMLVAGCTGVCRCGTRSVGRTCGCVCPPCVVDHWWTGCTIIIVWHSGRLMLCLEGSLRWWWWGRGVGEASGGCCRGMLRTRPPVGTHLALPLHTSHAITAITMHLWLLLGARGARLGGGWLCGRAVRPLSHLWHAPAPTACRPAAAPGCRPCSRQPVCVCVLCNHGGGWGPLPPAQVAQHTSKQAGWGAGRNTPVFLPGWGPCC